MKLQPWQKTALSVLVITGGGFLLFNAAFMLAALFFQAGNWVVSMITGKGPYPVNQMLWAALFLVLLIVASWFVLRSKLPTLAKATFLTMPLMVLLIFLGILFYELPTWIPTMAGILLVGAILFFLIKKRLPWQYYVATLYTGALALVVALTGMEI